MTVNLMSFIFGDWIWILLIISLFADLLIPFILAFFYPGYSHRKNVMSDLGSEKSPVAKWYNLWLIIWGIVFIISAIKITFSYYSLSANLAIIGGVLVFICGLGGVISGFFPISSDKKVETKSDTIHGISSGLGFLALAFFPLISMKIYNKLVTFKSVRMDIFRAHTITHLRHLFVLKKYPIGNRDNNIFRTVLTLKD